MSVIRIETGPIYQILFNFIAQITVGFGYRSCAPPNDDPAAASAEPCAIWRARICHGVYTATMIESRQPLDIKSEVGWRNGSAYTALI